MLDVFSLCAVIEMSVTSINGSSVVPYIASSSPHRLVACGLYSVLSQQDFSFLKSVITNSGAHPASCLVGTSGEVSRV